MIGVKGQLMDYLQNKPVEEALVELFTRKIESGIYSANYTLFDAVQTDANGQFSFEIPDLAYTSVKLAFSKKDYFGWSYELEGDVLRSSQGMDEVFKLDPKAWITVRVINERPVSIGDYFEYRLLNGYGSCEDCCQGEIESFTGRDIDQVRTCMVVGHQDILIQWMSRKDGIQEGATDLFFVEAFGTTEITLSY